MPISSSVAELFPLVPRDRCTQCTTVCAGATFGQFLVQRCEPVNATELCGCGHPYWQHYITRPAIQLAPNASSVSAVARASCEATGCGGFIPLLSPSTTMSLQTPCACGAPYLQHIRDIPDVAPPPRISGTHATPGRVTPAQLETSLPALATGVTAGIPTPLAAVRTVGTYSPSFVAPVASSQSASQQRQASASRTRRAGFAYNSSQGPTPGPTTGIPSRKGKKTATPLPSKLKCAMIPFANPANSDSPGPPNMFRLTDIQRDQLLPQLAKWNLVIPVTEPAQSEIIWEALDESITHHLQAHNITIERPAPLQQHPYFNLSWSVCQAARTNKTGISNYTPSTPPQYAFTFQYLQAIAWPDPIEEGYGVFFVAPRKKNLQGPLPESSDPTHHPCWPWRVVSPFHNWLRFGGENDLYQANSCIVECHINDGEASGDDDEFQPSPVTRKRYLPPVIVHPRPVRRVRLDSGPAQSQPPLPSFPSASSSQAAAAQPLFKPDSPSTECSSHNNRSPTPPPVVWRPTLDDRLPESSIRQWQTSIQIKRQVSQATTPYLKGPKAAELATFLISIIDALAQQKPVPENDNDLGVTAKDINTLDSLFKPFPDFFLADASRDGLGADTSGTGLVRTVYQSVLQQSTKSHRWIPSTNKGYHRLHLSRNPELDIVNQAMDYRVEGQIAALFTTHLAIGPDPISPFIILAVTINRLEEFEFDIDFARAMIHDEDLLNKVEQILNLPVGEIKQTDMSKAWLHFLASNIELPANHLTQPRPVEVHRKMQKQMLAYELIGDRDPWKHPNFQEFKAGFNCIPPGPFLKHPLAPWDEPRYLQRFLATLYNRRIESPGDVISLIRWHVTNITNVDNPTTYNLCRLFIMRFMRWIEGIGHPRDMKDSLITSQEYTKARLDRGLRARLFHQVVTGCSLKLNWEDEFIHIRLDYRSFIGDEDTVRFSVCTNTVYVHINKEIARLLVQPGQLDAEGKEVCTEFDMWWHAQMIVGDDFNRA
ncbi:hypothetical protein F5887DRAFT_1082974 [Amanita rubescens]|nr:hypothetical protein F5887DRAFT_1082974 [Amanita rubescens]